MDNYEVRIVQIKDMQGNKLPYQKEYTVIVCGKKSVKQLMDFAFENGLEMMAKKVGD